METQQKARGQEEKNLTWLAVAALALALFCMVNLFSDVEDDDAQVPTPPPMVSTAANDTGDGPRVVGGFVPEHREPPMLHKTETVFLSWEFINGLFAIILLFEFVVMPVLMWLWFGKKKEPSP